MNTLARTEAFRPLALAFCILLQCGNHSILTDASVRNHDAQIGTDAAGDVIPSDIPDAAVIWRQPTDILDQRISRNTVRIAYNTRSISLGNGVGCIVTLEGIVACWGTNVHGALEDADQTRVLVTAEVVPGLSDVISLASVGNGFCAARQTGSVWCWGQFFRPFDSSYELPARRPLMQAREAPLARQIVGALAAACVTDERNAVWCWGSNRTSRFGVSDERLCRGEGIGISFNCRREPSIITSEASIAIGGGTSCLVEQDGVVQCLGGNEFGEISGGVPDHCPESPCPFSTTPVRIAFPSEAAITSVAVGIAHVCAVNELGSVYCWGNNSNGQLGRGNATVQTNVAAVPLPGPARAVVSSSYVTCAILRDGSAWCWGGSVDGVVGQGAQASVQTTPALLMLPTAVTSIALSDSNGCALLSDGDVWCWGRNSIGFLGPEADTVLVARPVRRP